MQPLSPPTTSKRSVFISHSSKNAKLAGEVCTILEEKGMSCWIAPRDIPAGGSYGTEIISGISQCSVFLLLLTHESNPSPAVHKEVERASHYNKVIIPLRIADITPAQEIEFFVSTAQWVDAIHTPLRKRMDEVAAIVHAVETSSQLPPVPAEKKTLAGNAEKWVERAFRHKTLSFAGAFGGLALLILAGIYLQSRSVETIERSGTEISEAATSIKSSSGKIANIDSKIDLLKKEVSDDPRKELFNMGLSFHINELLTNVDNEKIVALFLQNGEMKAQRAEIIMALGMGSVKYSDSLWKLMPGGTHQIPLSGRCWEPPSATNWGTMDRYMIGELMKDKGKVRLINKLCAEQDIPQRIKFWIKHLEEMTKKDAEDFSAKIGLEESRNLDKEYAQLH